MADLKLRFCSALFAALIIQAIAMDFIAQEANFRKSSRMLSSQSTNASCPVQFNYVKIYKSSLDICRGINGHVGKVTSCCDALLNTFGIGIGLNLRQTRIFEFPNYATAVACLNTYQTQLARNGVVTNFLNTCFPDPYPDPGMFVSNASLCAGIVTVDDWNAKVGTTDMDTSCKGDLSDSVRCTTCISDAKTVFNKLVKYTSSTAEQQQCIYFASLYGSSIVNVNGPTDTGTATCLLAATIVVHQTLKHKFLIYGFVTAICMVIFLGGLLLHILKRTSETRKRNSLRMRVQSFLPNTGLIQFKYEDLKLATQNFSKKAIIGEGGFGTVYRGTLGSIEVGVKLMKNVTSDGDAEFLNEMEVINKVRHRNLVHLRGCCVHGTKDGHQRILVYDYMPNGSVENVLHGPNKNLLTWPLRRKIAIGMATGINYLHNEIQPAIIHRDIKPSNILLDNEYNARVADFGLAKITPEGMTHLTTRVAGTPVYIAVEYALYGQLSEKTDVYSFGIVLLELMSGRKALDTSCGNPLHFHIVDWAWGLAKEGKAKEIIDESIRGSGPVSIMERFVLIGILCAHVVVGFRPTMIQVLRMLEGDEDIPRIPDRPASYISESNHGVGSVYNYNHSVILPSGYSVDILP